MNNIESMIEEILNALFLELPTTVISGFQDALDDLKQERGEVYPVYPSLNIKEKELVANPRPARLPKWKYSWKSRHRVRDLLLISVKEMETGEAFEFLRKVIYGWLLNASKDYLLCDYTGKLRSSNESRRELVIQTLYTLVRTFDD